MAVGKLPTVLAAGSPSPAYRRLVWLGPPPRPSVTRRAYRRIRPYVPRPHGAGPWLFTLLALTILIYPLAVLAVLAAAELGWRTWRFRRYEALETWLASLPGGPTAPSAAGLAAVTETARRAVRDGARVGIRPAETRRLLDPLVHRYAQCTHWLCELDVVGAPGPLASEREALLRERDDIARRVGDYQAALFHDANSADGRLRPHGQVGATDLRGRLAALGPVEPSAEDAGLAVEALTRARGELSGHGRP